MASHSLAAAGVNLGIDSTFMMLRSGGVPKGTLQERVRGREREAVTTRLLFTPAHLIEVCNFNRIDPALTLADEDMQRWIIAEWYCMHREAGGEADAVAEQVVAEVAAELDGWTAARQARRRHRHGKEVRLLNAAPRIITFIVPPLPTIAFGQTPATPRGPENETYA